MIISVAVGVVGVGGYEDLFCNTFLASTHMDMYVVNYVYTFRIDTSFHITFLQRSAILAINARRIYIELSRIKHVMIASRLPVNISNLIIIMIVSFGIQVKRISALSSWTEHEYGHYMSESYSFYSFLQGVNFQMDFLRLRQYRAGRKKEVPFHIFSMA